MENFAKNQSKMDLFTVNNNTAADMECSICCKAIQKTFFRCGAPCNKIFHISCMEQMIERTEEAAWEEDKEPEHKCCYCRRQIDIDLYLLQRIARHFSTLKASGCYDVSRAFNQIKAQINEGELDEEIEYEIFEIKRIYYEKKPKQSKKAAAKKPIHHAPRMRVKQNIGGRRR
jgi:hypothetical protein